MGEVKNVRLMKVTPDAEAFMAYAARVSSEWQDNPSYEKLFRYCLYAKKPHWSVFEMADMTLEIKTERDISAQIIRHRSFNFQEFCVAGDTELYFDAPSAVKRGERSLHHMKISDFYRKWSENKSGMRSRLERMYLRVFDEDTQLFTNAHVAEVKKTGIKPIFEVVLGNGKRIKCTKEHRFLTSQGWQALEDAVGLTWRPDRLATMSILAQVACNGVPCYQDKDWLTQAKEHVLKERLGRDGIAAMAGGVHPKTIYKWMKKYGLQFTDSEAHSMYDPWNKGQFGYHLPPHSEATKEKMRSSARRGPDSNFWKGGVGRSWRLQVARDISKHRREMLKKFNYQCQNCGCGGKLQLHHVVPVYENPDLALDIDNIQPLCKDCHGEIHKTRGDHKRYRERSKGNQLTVEWSTIESVTYIGEEETYDLEVHHDSHNYVANGIVVHNSTRYAQVRWSTPKLDFRYQDTKNRQNSIEDPEHVLEDEFGDDVSYLLDQVHQLYTKMLSAGVAKEVARRILPLATDTTLFMKGSVRSWIHYIDVRTDMATQTEHRLIAEQCKDIFKEQFPTVSKVLGWVDMETIAQPYLLDLKTSE